MKSPIYLCAGTPGLYLCAAVLLAFARPVSLVHAAVPSTATAAERSNRFTFSLLPKSLQRRPSLDFHVVTELTDEGRKRAPTTPAQPLYYLAQPGKFTQMGNNTWAGETPPNVEQLTRAMEAALANGAYLKAAPTTPLPAIVVIFNYGSFARFSMMTHDMEQERLAEELNVSDPILRSDDRDTDTLLPIVLSNRTERDDVLRRAGLIGGEKFSRDLADAFNAEVVHRARGDAMHPLGMINTSSPFHLFMNANENLMTLVEDSFNGCYFVIASAFDYVAMKKGRRVLLWRTKMTVNSSGISMTESLPSLVLAAGPYLGKEMSGAVTLTQRINRGGKVDLGETRVVETDVAIPGGSQPGTSSAPASTAEGEKRVVP